MCILALTKAFSEMLGYSVAATKRARVSVTGGGVGILFSFTMKDKSFHIWWHGQ
jgi:hypothetical protein